MEVSQYNLPPFTNMSGSAAFLLLNKTSYFGKIGFSPVGLVINGPSVNGANLYEDIN